MDLSRQQETPLFTGLIHHRNRNPIQFHIPGHKKGKGMDEEFRQFIGENALSIDLINISPLDDLHAPHGIIMEAQKLAAEAFGADHTFFSVQGTSGAIMAMVLSVVKPGEKIIVPRNVHKSVLSAIIFAGAIPIFIHPVMDRTLGIAHGITTSAVKKALAQHPDAKAILMINPTYFGIAANLREIVQLAHQHGIPVLVDEAHGVHIHFHPDLPDSAMQAGADMSATSVHKLGGSLTQSSILNVKEGIVKGEQVQPILSMLTTTSTSYLLLASLDTARRQLALHGKELLDRTIALAEKTRKAINKIPGLYCMGQEVLGEEATFALDPTKLTIHVSELGLSGYQVEQWLREHYSIEVELSDLYNILCIFTPGDREEDAEILVRALHDLSKTYYNEGKRAHIEIHLPKIPVLALSPREAFYAETERVPLHQAAGKIMAEFIMVYPPGIPILMPGEIITEENIRYIDENIESGLPVQGPEDPTLEYVKVIREFTAVK
ncbi:MAG: aminotransferase class I/II-fold pyridoxal phosphate-dependent enzyme [Thermicanus sp.]|nr:aminotransferase class I/II-fold pyridoxal phosphate-dependent enzyme [Thermicanus sp.]